MKNSVNNSALTVVKHNAVIEAGYHLSIYESRVLLTCISQIDSMGTVDPGDKFIVTAQDLSDLSGAKGKRAYEYLEKATDKLLGRLVIINLQEGKTLKMNWVSSAEYIPKMGTVEIKFAQDMIPYISQLRRDFTQYRLKNILMFKSNYSIRIYELLVKWGGNEKIIEVDWLKRQFHIEDKYPRVTDLKKRVVDVAVDEINKHSDMMLGYDQIKQGRNVTGFRFKYKLKSDTKKSGTKEQTWYGITTSDIEKEARRGESYPEAAKRITESRKATKGK